MLRSRRRRSRLRRGRLRLLTHPGQKAYIRLGYNGVLAKIGTFWIDSLTPTEASRNVALRLLDRLETLSRTTVNYGPAAAVRLDNVARGLLTAAGLIEGEHFVLDVAETTAVWAVAVAANPVAELQDLALAEGGRTTDLGTLGGSSTATAINDRGQIVGISYTSPGDGPIHAFLWQDGFMTDLGTLGADPASYANDINDRGQIVGSCGDWPAGRVRHPVMWTR